MRWQKLKTQNQTLHVNWMEGSYPFQNSSKKKNVGKNIWMQLRTATAASQRLVHWMFVNSVANELEKWSQPIVRSFLGTKLEFLNSKQTKNAIKNHSGGFIPVLRWRRAVRTVTPKCGRFGENQFPRLCTSGTNRWLSEWGIFNRITLGGAVGESTTLCPTNHRWHCTSKLCQSCSSYIFYRARKTEEGKWRGVGDQTWREGAVNEAVKTKSDLFT